MPRPDNHLTFSNYQDEYGSTALNNLPGGALAGLMTLMDDKYKQMNPLPLSDRGRMGFVYSSKPDNFGLVLKVIDNSPAALGKLTLGDHILDINGKLLLEELPNDIYSDTAGYILPIQADVPEKIGVLRDSTKLILSITPSRVGWIWSIGQNGQPQLNLGFEAH